jgi:hypothetical protein
LGFYRKCGIELVREQIEKEYTHFHPYDIDQLGLLVWPTKRFDVEIVSDLRALDVIRPNPEFEAAQAGMVPTQRTSLIFSATHTSWKEWETIWSPRDTAASVDSQIPVACLSPPLELTVAVRS